jgi:tetratricopeptide (TPR) repeat protein/DNA-binding winged helix-turn-helix (wHTH) protein
MMISPARPIYRIGDVEVDPDQSCVRRDGEQQRLRPQTFQVLLYLVERRARLVTKEELIERVWQGATVTDDALVQCIVDLRRSLGDDPRHPRFIKTIPKAGYCFIAEVEEAQLISGKPAELCAAVEFEETTSVEIEIEEEVEVEIAGDDARRLPDSSVARRVLSPARRWLSGGASRVATVFAGVIGIGVLAVLLARGFRPAPEIALPQLPGKRPIAVLHFENRSGDRELDWLREGLADMLITNLSRSKTFSVLSRQQLYLLLERIGREDARELRLDEAQEIARRARAEAIVMGSFARLGGQTRIDASLHDARTGQLIASESLIADKPERILSQVDLLSLKLAAHLGAAVTEQGNKIALADVMTNNLEAYRCYSLALERMRSYHTTEAIALLEKAIALDPQFAMAYARIGYVRLSDAEKARPYLERAFRLAHRLTAKDKLYVLAWYSKPGAPEMIRTYREIVNQYPQEIEAWWRLGLELQYQGKSEEAIDAFKSGLVMDPEAQELYNQIGNYYAGLGRYAEAVAAHQRYVELAPNEANAYDSLAMTYNEAGRYEDAIAALDRALALKPQFHFAHLHLGDSYFGQGRYKLAERQYRQYQKLAPSVWDSAVSWQRLTRLYWRKGDLERAAAMAREAWKLKYEFGENMYIALARGDWQTAEKFKEIIYAAVPDTDPQGAAWTIPQPYYHRGYYALKLGRNDEAIEYLKKARQATPVFFWYEDLGPDALANAYLELGRWDEAIAEYERLLRLNPNWAWAQYRLGLAYERKGEGERAGAAYERFLQIWKDADEDIPEVIDAKARLAKQPI